MVAVVTATLSDAYAACVRDARRHYENFPVASLLVPRAQRPHIAAVYAFARAADDFADEGDRSNDERHRLLDGWLLRLRDAVSRRRALRPVAPGEPAHTHQIFTAIGATIHECRLPVALLEDLLSAFRQDVTVTRYETWTDLFDYCRRSANPVGRLVLRIAGYDEPRFDQWSDAICTALQLTNFWQDAKHDFDRGRIYLPLEELQLHRASPDALAAGRIDGPWALALAAAARRTRSLFDAGRPLCDDLRGRLKYELRATWLGGVRVLARLEAAKFDVITDRPTLGAADGPWLAWRLASWRPLRA
jgi:hydroxysqualene synthase